MNAKYSIRLVCMGLTVMCLSFFSQQSFGVPPATNTTTKYFSSANLYPTPVRPYHEITYQEAVKQRAYYEATYDEKGKILFFQKYLDGRTAFRHEYEYDEEGVISACTVIRSDGRRTRILPKEPDKK